MNFHNELTSIHPDAKINVHLGGHSLGGTLVKELCKSNPNTTCTTFEAPNLHFLNGGKTYANITEFRQGKIGPIDGDIVTTGQSMGNEVHRIHSNPTFNERYFDIHSMDYYTESIDKKSNIDLTLPNVIHHTPSDIIEMRRHPPLEIDKCIPKDINVTDIIEMRRHPASTHDQCIPKPFVIKDFDMHKSCVKPEFNPDFKPTIDFMHPKDPIDFLHDNFKLDLTHGFKPEFKLDFLNLHQHNNFKLDLTHGFKDALTNSFKPDFLNLHQQSVF